MQRSLVWKKLGDLLNGVSMTAVWMTGVWRRRVGNQGYVRDYPRLGAPVAEKEVEAGEGAEGVELAAESAYLHVGEDMTRARPDTPTPCSDPRGSVHRFAASSRPAPSDAASSCLLHVGEDMTRARPDTPTPCSDPRGSVHRGAASSRPAPSDAASACLLLIQTGSVRRRECMPCVAWDSVGR